MRYAPAAHLDRIFRTLRGGGADIDWGDQWTGAFAPVAKAAGAFVVEINLDATPHSGVVDVALQGRAKDIVPLLVS